MLSAQTIINKVILKDTFLTDIESLAKRIIARITVYVLCFLGITVFFLLATRIVLLVFLISCTLMNYVPSIPFLTG